MAEEKLSKGFSFRLNLEDPVERELSCMLAGKPTTYIIIEALKLFKRFEEAREQSVENAIASIERPTMSVERYKKLAPGKRSDNDDIEDFDL